MQDAWKSAPGYAGHVGHAHLRGGRTYIRRRAIRHLEKDRVVIFAAGTGNPYFSRHRRRAPGQ
jgi:hypothetical protein